MGATAAMDEVLTATEQQTLVASFLEIAVGQTVETARQFLQATSWHLEEAIQLFLLGSEFGGQPLPFAASRLAESSNSHDGEDIFDIEPEDRVANVVQGAAADGERPPLPVGAADDGERPPLPVVAADDGVRPPLPVRREVLYDDAAVHPMQRPGYPPYPAASMIAFRNFEEESRRSDVWESGQATSSTAKATQDNLASLYKPPFSLIFQGPFEQAKVVACNQGKWLLVNLQSPKEFSSHMLNRDTWGNEAVAQTVKSNFIFWQVYDETSEGKKVCTYYNLYAIPVILVIDPITGQNVRSWNGMVEPQRLLEDLLPYMDKGPKDYIGLPHNKRQKGSPPSTLQTSLGAEDSTEEDEELLKALAVSMEQQPQARLPQDGNTEENYQSKEQEDKAGEKEDSASITNPVYPPLPEEAKGDRNLLCRVRVRLPDGRRIQRNFLRADSTQLLWSFCHSQLKEEERNQPFRLTEAIPGASRTLDYHSNQTLEEAKLSNAMLSLAWE